MHWFRRHTVVPLIWLGLFVVATAWAISFGSIEPADFTFCNGTEIKSVDPAIVTGQPEGRIIYGIFEGLVNWDPKTLDPIPGVAENVHFLEDEGRWECISPDGLTYTFLLRKDARWSDDTPVTAHDFQYSFQRMLNPMTGSEYSYQLFDYVVNAKKYATLDIEAGDPVEVELNPASDALPGARGKLLYGKLLEVQPGATEDDPSTYTVEIDGQQRVFRPGDGDAKTEACQQVLFDFREVGIKALDEQRFELKIMNRTPYFLNLMGFYPLFPVNQRCVERYGSPNWTKPENIVTNGAFLLAERRIRDRIRLTKSPFYWDRENVKANIIDALAVESDVTMLNMYLAGQVDWIPNVPATVVGELLSQQRPDFNPTPELTIYFYRLNVTRPPLDDVRVRQALAMAVDKKQIVDTATKAGEIPAGSFVPPGIPKYDAPAGLPFDPERARQLLADAGYPGGKGFPKIDIQYNSSEAHKAIAELIQMQWRTTLGIDVGLRNQEWASHLASTRLLTYDVSRSGWIGDYVDPNTFLDLFKGDGPNNQTGWENKQYDDLINAAASETDPGKRLELFHEAEEILLEQVPVIPVYFRVSKNMVRPWVRGFYDNVQDVHPLRFIWVDNQEKEKYLEEVGIE